jgi:adenylate kinase
MSPTTTGPLGGRDAPVPDTSPAGPGRILVSVIGPPGAGKSTVVAALATASGIPVFRLREAIRGRPDLLTGLAPSGDQLGWVSQEAVNRVLSAVLLERPCSTGSGPVLLDNFPGTADQLALLTELTSPQGWPVTILELRAGTPAVTARVAARRVCPHCGPDPHTPAAPVAGDGGSCAGCGGALVHRDTDTPSRHALRLARYRANAPGILAAASRLRLRLRVIDASRAPEVVTRAARAAVTELTTPTTVHRSGS